MTDTATREQVTLSQATIHNPKEVRHFMRIKPAGRHVRVCLGDKVLAQSDRALRLIEAGRDMYDPVLYIPRADISGNLKPAAKDRTYCPLKGHASYFDLVSEDGTIASAEIAWSYEDTLDFASELKDLVAFDASRVTIV